MKDRWLEEGYTPPPIIVNDRFKCYCAATAIAVAGVAAAATTAYSSYSQSQAQKKQAEDAQTALNGNPSGAYGTKVNVPDYVDNVGTPQGEGQQVFGDFKASLPALTNVASQINAYGLKQRDRVSGGTFRKNLEQQGTDINSMLSGEIPSDVSSEINRQVAEKYGSSFDPSVPGGYAGGISQTGGALARSLGLSSLDIMGKGMSYAPQWEQLVDSFTYKPGQAIQDANTFLSAAQIQIGRDQNKYNAGLQQAQAAAQPDPTVAGPINDNLKLGNIQSQADANQMKALSGLISTGVGGANSIYQSFKTPSLSTPYANNGYSYTPGVGYATIPKIVG